MKFLLSCLLFASVSYAQIDFDRINKTHCQNLSSQTDDGYTYINSLHHYRANNNDYFIQAKVDGFYLFHNNKKVLLEHLFSLKDFIVIDQTIWTIGKDGLFKYSMSGDLIKNIDNNLKEHEDPRSLVLDSKSKRVFMASSRRGIEVFNLNNEKITLFNSLSNINKDGGKSAAVGLDIDDQGILFVAMSRSSQNAFDGLIALDTKTNNVIAKAQYNQRTSGVIFPHIRLYIKGSSIFLNNGGWIHKLKREDILSNKKLRPNWLAIINNDFEVRQYLQISGDFIFQNNNIYGCSFIHRYQQRDQISDLSVRSI